MTQKQLSSLINVVLVLLAAATIAARFSHNPAIEVMPWLTIGVAFGLFMGRLEGGKIRA